MLHVLYEGTPVAIPVPSSAGYFEAGNIGMLLTESGKTVVKLSDGTAAYGMFADRRGTTASLSNVTPLHVDRVEATGERNIGDESLFNQPGILNPLDLIPDGTIRTTTLLPDETLPSGKVTMYIRGGEYETDQFVDDDSYHVGDLLYSSAVGVLTTVQGNVTDPSVGSVVTPPSTYKAWLHFKLTIV